MRGTLAVSLALVLLGTPVRPATSQESPPARPADVESLDAIIAVLYEVISGPAGPRDWDRFESLFAPGARLIPTFPQSGVTQARVMTPAEFGGQAQEHFSTTPFYEVEVARTIEEFGPLVHAFSTYESRREPRGEPFVRGINSIQLLNDGQRWWILSIMWADERSAGAIPDRYFRSGSR